MIFESILYILSGFIFLTLSGNFLVKGAVSIAKSLKVSTLVIGVTVVSMGTSAPELIVSLGAVLQGATSISIGNVVGSNISNIALVLGLTAIVFPISVKRSGIKWDWIVMMISTLVFILFLYTNSALEFWEGIVFVLSLSFYVVWTILRSRKDSSKSETDNVKVNFWFNSKDFLSLFNREDRNIPVSLALVSVLIASVGLYFGADFLIKGSVNIARYFGLTERIIAVSVIALGTSIPELATSITAAFKKEMEISIGNIIGSNIFNVLGILGITSIVRSISIDDWSLLSDIYWQLGLSFLLILLIIPFSGKCNIVNRFSTFVRFLGNKEMGSGVITRLEGGLLFLLYVAYIVWVFV